MFYIGIDLHKYFSQVTVMDKKGTIKDQKNYTITTVRLSEIILAHSVIKLK